MQEVDFRIHWKEPRRLRRLLEKAGDPYKAARRAALWFVLTFAFAMILGEVFDALKGGSLSLKEKLLISSGMAGFFAFVLGPLTWGSDRFLTISREGVSCSRPSFFPGEFAEDCWPWEDVATAFVAERTLGLLPVWVLELHCRDGKVRQFALDGTVNPDEVAGRLAANAGKIPPSQPRETPRGGRAAPALSAIVGLLVGAVNVWLRRSGFWHVPVFILVAPGALLVGVVSIVEPRVFWSVHWQADRLPYPRWTKVINVLCWVVGLAVGLYLLARLDL